MKITSKGQVTIPLEIRRKAGLMPFMEIDFIWDGKSVRLIKKKEVKQAHGRRGEMVVSHLTGGGQSKLTTDQIMSLTRGED